ncbi:MAG: hypothetical protein IPH53_17640 [Flavobacteriales bacterium]|nr:hypothetical protein [Flavobacteriales bacterium]
MRTNTSKILITATFALALAACGGGTPATPPGAKGGPPGAGEPAPHEHSKEAMITAADLTLGDIDNAMAEKGKTTYDVKCQACHSMGRTAWWARAGRA